MPGSFSNITPTVYLGDTRDAEYRRRMRTLDWGRCIVDREPDPTPGERWFLDNGAFRQWNAARKRAGMTEAAYIAAGSPGVLYDRSIFEHNIQHAQRLAKQRRGPAFAVLPDEVGAGVESLFCSIEWLDDYEAAVGRDDPLVFIHGIAAGDIPLYLPVQNGMDPAQIAEITDSETGTPLVQRIRGIFLGGDPDWKAKTARAWARLCGECGLAFHFARAGTPAKLALARRVGAVSIDSATPLFTRARFDEFVTEWLNGSKQMELPFAA